MANVTLTRAGAYGAAALLGGATTAVASRVLDQRDPTARNKNYHTTASASVFGSLALGTVFGTIAASKARPSEAARMVPAVSRLGVAALAGGALGALGYGAIVGATRCNTTDIGLNELEQGEFTAAHHRRLAPYAGIGVAAGAGIGLVSGGARGAGIGALLGMSVGAAMATQATAAGQAVAYAPSADAVEDVADALWRGIRGAADRSGSVEAGPAESQPSGRSSFEAEGSVFYDAADRTGNGDGRVDFDELATHVRSFDADGDGRVGSGAEWNALHAAIVA